MHAYTEWFFLVQDVWNQIAATNHGWTLSTSVTKYGRWCCSDFLVLCPYGFPVEGIRRDDRSCHLWGVQIFTASSQKSWNPYFWQTQPNLGESELAKQFSELDIWPQFQPVPNWRDLAQQYSELDIWICIQPEAPGSELAKPSVELDIRIPLQPDPARIELANQSSKLDVSPFIQPQALGSELTK